MFLKNNLSSSLSLFGVFGCWIAVGLGLLKTPVNAMTTVENIHPSSPLVGSHNCIRHLTQYFFFSLKMATCCENILKYAIFLLNFVFFLASVGLISIGAYLEYQKSTYLSFLDSPYLNTSIVLIIIGVVMLVVSFFGCCGACTENKCMLMTYATLLVLITLALIAVSIAIYVFKVLHMSSYFNI